jgi:hypothetical protein
VLVGVIDVASDVSRPLKKVADTIGRALQFVARERLFPCTNCGMAPMSREVAEAKLQALAQGAALARQRYGGRSRSTGSACLAPWPWWRGAARWRCSSTWAARTRPRARR